MSLRWTKHPILDLQYPPYSDDLVAELAETEEGKAAVLAYYEMRENAILLAESDPLHHGFEPPWWAEADAQAERCEILANFGANRSGKSLRAAKRICEAAVCFRGGLFVICGESESSSIVVQQRAVWLYLRKLLEPFNYQRHDVIRCSYNPSKGFGDRQVALPNGSEIWFRTYNQVPSELEGWELGGQASQSEHNYKHRDWLRKFWGGDVSWATAANGMRVCVLPNGRRVMNHGWWADESMPMGWLEVLARRGAFRRAAGVWAFTPVKGLTPSMKDLLGTNLEMTSWAPSDLLPQASVHGCPRGQMPVTAVPHGTRWPSVRVRWTHYHENPFGEYAGMVKALCQDKTTEYVERIGYGYARDMGNRMFPNFGPWNIVKRAAMPTEGTRYMFCDPHDARRYCCLWVMVPPHGTDPAVLYVYRDWPDQRTYGEWAVMSEREVTADTRKGWDGDPGPAQATDGWGITEYKRLWRELERGETIRERWIDARFAASKHAQESGHSCLLWQFLDEHEDPGTGEKLGPVQFQPATGESTEVTLPLVQSLLDCWNRERPLVLGVNAPRLFVSEECEQTIWAMSNYTGRAGATGASKDFVDLVRHAAAAGLTYVEPGWNPHIPGGGY